MGWTTRQVSFCSKALAIGIALAPFGGQAQTQLLQLAGGGQETALGGELAIQAAHLRYQPRARRLELSGKVVVSCPTLRLAAEKLTVLLDEQGAVRSLAARGKVTLKHGQLSGRAEEARLAVKQNTLWLKGQVALELVDLGVALGGRQVELDLATGQLAATAASARLAGNQQRGGRP